MTQRMNRYLGAAWALLLGGLILRYSLLAPLAENSGSWLIKELIHLMLAGGAFYVASRISRERLISWGRPLMLVAIAMLVLMAAGFSVTRNGASRWLDLGFIKFQPSEIIKAFVLIYIAGYVARHRETLSSFRHGLLPALSLLAVVFLLIMKQPDFGTSILLMATGVWMLWIGGSSWRQIAGLGLTALPGLILVITTSPYRLRRVLSWWSPESDLEGAGYQVNQAKWAITHGGWFGTGLLNGTARHGYLPEGTNDFILAIYIEECGFVGLLVLLLGYGLLLQPLLAVAREAGALFDRLLIGGLAALIGFQALFNLGVVTGLLPNKGIPLPLVSAGGTSLVMTGCLLGLGWRIMKGHESTLTTEDATNVRTPDPHRIWNGL